MSVSFIPSEIPVDRQSKSLPNNAYACGPMIVMDAEQEAAQPAPFSRPVGLILGGTQEWSPRKGTKQNLKIWTEFISK